MGGTLPDLWANHVTSKDICTAPVQSGLESGELTGLGVQNENTDTPLSGTAGV